MRSLQRNPDGYIEINLPSDLLDEMFPRRRLGQSLILAQPIRQIAQL